MNPAADCVMDVKRGHVVPAGLPSRADSPTMLEGSASGALVSRHPAAWSEASPLQAAQNGGGWIIFSGCGISRERAEGGSA